MSDAQITVIGNATKDVDLTFGPSGSAIAKFGIAVNKRVKQGDEWVDGDPTFLNVTAFGSVGENCAESVSKGTRVVVVGRIEMSTWEKDGEKRTGYDVIADEVGVSLRWATCVTTRNEKRT